VWHACTREEGIMSSAAIAERLGGSGVISQPIRTDLDWVEALQAGLPTGSADALVAGGSLSQDELFRLVIPRRTLAKRRQTGGTLTPEESDRLARVARVLASAEDVFGAAEKAHRWLRKANRGLGGHLPIHLLSTEAGSRLVEQALGRIEHGIMA
jgi:putative toxin-antitoxin system antitoxin component (TIGR02293 family)